MVTPILGPLQLAIHVVQNRRAGEKKSHWDKTNKSETLLHNCVRVTRFVWGVLCIIGAINKGGFFEIAFVVVVDTHLPRFEALD